MTNPDFDPYDLLIRTANQAVETHQLLLQVIERHNVLNHRLVRHEQRIAELEQIIQETIARSG